jgi:hypothetical protein
MTSSNRMTAQELWQKYEDSRKDSKILISFHDLIPFLTDQQVQVPVSHFLLKFFDRWMNVDQEMSEWFVNALRQETLYSEFLLNLARNSLQSDEDVNAFKKLELNLITYLMTDHHEIVADILIKISMQDSGYLMSEDALNQFHQLVLKNNTYKIRCFELIIKVACISNDHLQNVVDSTLIKSWINDFKSRDLLVALNVIEMATHVIHYLFKL